jgi:hypothetical protein
MNLIIIPDVEVVNQIKILLNIAVHPLQKMQAFASGSGGMQAYSSGS